MGKIPNNIRKLFDRRNNLRNSKKYTEADAIRKKIMGMGYKVADWSNSSKVIGVKRELKAQKAISFLTLIGSGEISSVGRRMYEFVLSGNHKESIRIAIVTTPAGFQPNVKIVHEEISRFFLGTLKNFHPRVSIVYANDQKTANNARVLEPLRTADMIFIGPGSPTYAVKHLADTRLLEIIKRRLQQGTSLCLSSAAVLAFSRFTLPVYEIYKVGTPLFWEKGLDFFQDNLHYTTVIPHLNNREGGKKTDTSYCFMGKKRFAKLLSLLPKEEKIVGIDEQTAMVFDLSAKKAIVIGKGGIHPLANR